MKASTYIGAVGLLLGLAMAQPTMAPDAVARDAATDLLSDLQAQALEALKEVESTTAKRAKTPCTVSNAQRRLDWCVTLFFCCCCPYSLHDLIIADGAGNRDVMSAAARNSYIMAVQCLFTSKSKLTSFGWPTKTRYDDFVAVHINMTTTIHNTANFLGYHRNLVHAYENALRNECGYTGYAPVGANA